MKTLEDHYMHKEAVAECHGGCNEMQVVARAAAGEDLCSDHKLALLKQVLLDACIKGVTKNVDGVSGIEIEYVEYGISWQELILEERPEDEDEEVTVYRITITAERKLCP